MIEIPLGLRHALETGECVLFIGAGIGKHLLDAKGNPAPDGPTLAKELAERFSIETGGEFDLSKVSEVVEINKGRPELETFLKKRLGNLEPDKELQWLFSLKWRAIYTTNYDNGIQRAYELNQNPLQRVVTITSTPELTHYDSRFDVPVYHLHGALFGSAKPQIIITEKDYACFKESRKMLFELLKTEFATSCILYIGYANDDPNWKLVQSEIAQEFYPSSLPRAYRVAPQTKPLDIDILKARGIETINSTYGEFAEACAATLTITEIGADTLKRIRSNIPTDLIPFFDKNPIPLTRLLTSWTYVNQAPFDEKPNVTAFLRGDRPNWALVGSRQHFERDVEEQVYDELLDYATATTDKPKASIILGPAGYGTSTLMMSLAAKLVSDRVAAVFMLKPGNPIIEGDIDFASSLFPNRPFFFVDNAADYSSKLSSTIHRLRETGRTAMFVLGDRLNEWRQGHQQIVGQEFPLEPLSDPEIDRLLDCLGKHAELNKLQDLSREIQFATIKSMYKKQLLVAMREATEGKSFDAIIEDECRGIKDDLSRKAYLIVCGFYQHGAYIRDDLLAELLNISVADLYKKTEKSTDGVVIFECIDESNNRYAARARHRIIASIVWDRCSQEFGRDSILHESLAALNLNYGIDKEAFEFFIRSEKLVDSISNLEGKIKFFDAACQKDPTSPYVRQHYARMLSREHKSELALSQIDEALKINPKIRVLYHTKGMVLSQLAINIENVELARRRLTQSEASFRQGLSMYPKDDYCYQGLAQLSFGWAKRSSTPTQESADYISKAESIITEGLKVVNVRDSLWIESAKIQEWLGKQPEQLKALENAVTESPGSIIARYLLGRAYRKTKQYPKALEVLDPIIKNHHEEFRAFVEYALSMIYLQKSYSEAIAVLGLSRLYGLGDPRFIATLGGMLIMDNRFSDAEPIFSESSKHNFTGPELNTIQFRPPDPKNVETPLRIPGKVIVVKAGWAIVESPEYPSFLCPSSKYNGLVMKRDLNITFEPAFTAKSRVADKPTLVSK